MRILYLFIFLLATISIGVYFIYTTSQSNEKKSLNLEKKKEIVLKSTNQKDNSYELIFYWADWCGFCKKIKPLWNETKKAIASKYKSLKISDINCNNPNNCYILNESQKTTIEGVPTILLRINNSNDIEYKRDSSNGIIGNKKADDMFKFLDLYLKN